MNLKKAAIAGSSAGGIFLTSSATVLHVKNKQHQKQVFLYDLSKIVFNYLKEDGNSSQLLETYKNKISGSNVVSWLKAGITDSSLPSGEEDTLENFSKFCDFILEKEQDSYNSLNNHVGALCFLDKGKEPEHKGKISNLFPIFSNTVDDSEIVKKIKNFDLNNQQLFEKYKEDTSSFENFLKTKLNAVS